jgi:hypothetical protein
MVKVLDESIKLELKEYLGKDYHGLSKQKKLQLLELYTKSRKTEAIYIFWFLNLHYAYVGKWWSLTLFILTIGGFGVWWLIDLFRLTIILREYNKTKAVELLKKLDEVKL